MFEENKYKYIPHQQKKKIPQLPFNFFKKKTTILGILPQDLVWGY